DLHPIVRGVTWSGVPDDARQAIYGALEVHFRAMPMVKDWHQVESLEDLTPAIEFYDKVIGLQRYDDALAIFRDRLAEVALYRLNASRQLVESLERLFPDGTDSLPRLSSARDQSWALNSLAVAYKLTGQPGAAVAVFRMAAAIDRRQGDQANLGVDSENVSDTLLISGHVRSAETSAREALIIARKRDDPKRERSSLRCVGMALAARCMMDDSDAALRRSLRIASSRKFRLGEGYISAHLAETTVRKGDPSAGRPWADRAWKLTTDHGYERGAIQAARLQGTAALFAGEPSDLDIAHERLHHALTRARACNLVEEELPALIALAELHRRRGEPDKARELLEDMWYPAERGPYPMSHADGLNVLAQIERDGGNHEAAVEAATNAFELAWCDGPPFAYHWGLERAREHLRDLEAPEPDMPPFDESNFDPMPEVEINPPDEFGGDSSAEATA
ncbi:MAG: tetratricopeptide repeat protein, partial [Phycisphaerales bacterium]